MNTIVVGVDGSAESTRALEWALAEARLRNATLVALYAYDYDPAWQTYAYAEGGVGVGLPADAETLAEEAHRHAEGLLEKALREAAEQAAGVTVTREAVADRRPARALVERSKTADLLVVGSRGRGGFAGLVLGSVSQQCAHHAVSPLVIVPPPPKE